jgi:hypothetical protein
MSQYQELPAIPGLYRVTTRNGTVHILDTIHGTWERRPSPRSQSFEYDNRPAPLSSLGDGWEVGGLGRLEVGNDTSGGGGSWHRTSFIATICDATEKDRPEKICRGASDRNGTERSHKPGTEVAR